MRQIMCRYCRVSPIVLVPDMGGRIQTLNIDTIPPEADPMQAGWVLVRNRRTGYRYVRPVRDLPPRLLPEVVEVLTFHLCRQKAEAWRDRRLRMAGFGELIIVEAPPP